jgi:hypothetical protein
VAEIVADADRVVDDVVAVDVVPVVARAQACVQQEREILRQRQRRVRFEVDRRSVAGGGIAAEIVRVPELALEPVVRDAAIGFEIVEVRLVGIGVVDHADVPAHAVFGAARKAGVQVDLVIDVRVAEVDVAGPAAHVPSRRVGVVETRLNRRIGR